MSLGRCSSCRGFVAAHSKSCPNCGANVRSVGAGAIATVGGVIAAGAVAVTLMACYGCPDCTEGETYCPYSATYVYGDASCPEASALDGNAQEASVDNDASEDANVNDADIADADDGG